MSRRAFVAAIVVAALAATAFASVARTSSRARPEGRASRGGGSQQRETATVQRRDLVERETFEGTLGYADARAVRSGSQGTITWVTEEGARLRRGSRLYEVDGRPVYAMWGDTPAWRTLDSSVDDGRDVLQLERNLAAMGYEPGDVDGEWDSNTTAAVKAWESDRGATEDGIVELGEVVFLSPDSRVGDVKVALGDAVGPGAEVLTATSTRRQVTVELDASRQTLVKEGDEVRVELPDGDTVSGRITEVGRVAQTPPDDEGAEPYVTVTISLRDDKAGAGFDQAPVDVGIAVERAKDVLAVPVTALLALAEGGFAVEREDGTLVRVKTGLFADGWVEVQGAGLTEGTKVVVAS
ncbi:MAG TPA: peptidoglycan-binding protein [Actinomycetota bacterium]|nr:peptidoglycan-binding protein [Actinomycetota bacterium]